jgi:hypothetical protein
MRLFVCYMCENNISNQIYRAHDKSFCCNTCRNNFIKLKKSQIYNNSIQYKKKSSLDNLSKLNNIYYSKNNNSRCNNFLEIILTYFKKIYINPRQEWDYYMPNL